MDIKNRMRPDFYFVLPILLASSSIVGFAQSAGTYHTKAEFDYYEIVKGGDSSDKNLPVLIAFHYSSSTPQETLSYYDSLTTPVRLIFPRGNYRKRNGYSYFPPDHYTQDSTTQMHTVRKTVDSVAVFLNALYKEYPVKPVVSGISQGGDISLLLAVYHPRLIKASFPLLGFMHRQAYESLKKTSGKKVPIHLYQGEADKIVAIDYTRKEVAFLQSIVNITLSSYPGLDHDVSPEMERDYSEKMRKWLSRASAR
jgi:predicted esterase